MTNKTCGECKHYLAEFYHCQKNDVMAESFNACEDFESKIITNGDKIIAGGMRAIAEFQQHLSCTNCVYFSVKMAGQELCHKPDDKTCTDGIEAWLNAPSESEGKMNKQTKFSCPNCDSEKIAMDKRPGGWFHCQDCHYSWQPYPVRFGFDAPPRKQTLFTHITASPEVLAPKFVYNRVYMEQGGDLSYWVSSYFSTIIPGKSWEYESEAIAATVAKLKEVAE